MTSTEQLTGERADLLQTLRRHRGFLLHTVDGLTDEQAATRTTVSELCLGGLIKHVAGTEQRWMLSPSAALKRWSGSRSTGSVSSGWRRARPWPGWSSGSSRWPTRPTS
ncbi:hypothetical protein GCM10027614_72850 [Micromonospora vulcania]